MPHIVNIYPRVRVESLGCQVSDVDKEDKDCVTEGRGLIVSKHDMICASANINYQNNQIITN